MKTFIIVYSIVSTVAALLTVTFVIIDRLLDRSDGTAVAEAAPEPIAVPVTVPEPAPAMMPPVVEEIDAVQADVAISDALAISSVQYERGMGVGTKYFVNIGDIDKVFASGDTVTLDGLKEAGLVSKKAKRVKILADGVLRKALTVKAEAFSVQAIKMIELTGGTVVILRD